MLTVSPKTTSLEWVVLLYGDNDLTEQAALELAALEKIAIILQEVEYINAGEDGERMCPRCGNSIHHRGCELASALEVYKRLRS